MQTMCQLFCAELVKSLVRSEKNQQVMSQAGLTEDILEHCSVALSDEQHPLHQPIHYAFERVATHCLSSKDLRYKFPAYKYVNTIPTFVSTKKIYEFIQTIHAARKPIKLRTKLPPSCDNVIIKSDLRTGTTLSSQVPRLDDHSQVVQLLQHVSVIYTILLLLQLDDAVPILHRV